MINKLIALIGSIAIWFIGITSRVKIINTGIIEKFKKEDQNYIYAFWHGRQLFLVYSHRFRQINILISQSQDGQLIADITSLFGFKAVRGSSTRGGLRALVELVHAAAAGDVLAFTPDGPKGPYREVQSGVLYVAQKTGLPIVPLTFSAKRKLVLNNWDKFVIPLPFNNIIVANGQPVYVHNTDNLEEKKKELQFSLNLLTAETDKLMEEA
ncbi:MAG: lysophospholipid acyltransferase family protein [Elusimicrobia bacterium]|nr:lysophospholipid acyltransferase family protein [Elusimicrobiota bacterium]